MCSIFTGSKEETLNQIRQVLRLTRLMGDSNSTADRIFTNSYELAGEIHIGLNSGAKLRSGYMSTFHRKRKETRGRMFLATDGNCKRPNSFCKHRQIMN